MRWSAGATDTAAPALIRLVTQIGSRFGLVVSEKLAAQAVPIVGAAGGAAVNYAFVEHFQSIAFGHFTVRRLERIYGGETIQSEYEKLMASDEGRRLRLSINGTAAQPVKEKIGTARTHGRQRRYVVKWGC